LQCWKLTENAFEFQVFLDSGPQEQVIMEHLMFDQQWFCGEAALTVIAKKIPSIQSKLQ
jgi:hypothetical protein